MLGEHSEWFASRSSDNASRKSDNASRKSDNVGRKSMSRSYHSKFQRLPRDKDMCQGNKREKMGLVDEDHDRTTWLGMRSSKLQLCWIAGHFSFCGYPVNLSCTVEYLLFHSKSLKYGLLQENTFHYPWIIFGHSGIEGQHMRDLLFSIARTSTNVLWLSRL